MTEAEKVIDEAVVMLNELIKSLGNHAPYEGVAAWWVIDEVDAIRTVLSNYLAKTHK